MLKSFTSDLPDDEANFMLEQTRLCLKVFLRKQLAQNFPVFSRVDISHMVHNSVFMEQRHFITAK